MILRALTLHQPWASLIAAGEKVYETRSWAPPEGLTHIAVHAGKRIDEAALKQEVFRRALNCWNPTQQPELPSGAILCVCQIVEVVQVDGRLPKGCRSREWEFGDFTAGRYAWKLDVVLHCVPPIRCRGAQRIWRLPADIERVLLETLR